MFTLRLRMTPRPSWTPAPRAGPQTGIEMPLNRARHIFQAAVWPSFTVLHPSICCNCGKTAKICEDEVSDPEFVVVASTCFNNGELMPIYCSQKGCGCKRPVEVVSTSSFLSNAADSSLGVALARWIQLETTKCWLAPLALTN